MVGITERAVQRILKDLETAGYIDIHKNGRNNRYTLNANKPIHHPAQRGHLINELLKVLSD